MNFHDDTVTVTEGGVLGTDRAEWVHASEHSRADYDHLPEAPMSGHFFWTLWGEPFLQRNPPGSYPGNPHYVARHSIDVVMPPADEATAVYATSAPTWVPTPVGDVLADVVALRHAGPRYEDAIAAGEAIRCPWCRFVSFSPQDVKFGFCGRCHAFTADEPGRALGGSTRKHLQEAGYNYTRETT